MEFVETWKRKKTAAISPNLSTETIPVSIPSFLPSRFLSMCKCLHNWDHIVYVIFPPHYYLLHHNHSLQH